MDSIKINEIIESLRNCLDEERFQHTLGVADMAVELAKRYGADAEKCYLAGILHDCAKCLPKDELLAILNSNRQKLQIEDCEFLNPKTYHAPAGAIVACEKYGVTDSEILSAIRWHTLGKNDMSLLEKIVYLADKIEEVTRPVEYREPIKKLLDADNGLDRAILETYRGTIKSLVDRDLQICYQTIDVYNALLKKINNL